MTGKLALSFALASLIVCIGGFLAVLSRLDARGPQGSAAPVRGRPPGVVPEEGGAVDAVASRDPLVKLDHLIERMRQMEEDDYDYFTDIAKDLYELKREVRQLKSTLKQVVQGLGAGALGSHGLGGIGWGLAPRRTAIDGATAQAYREEAARQGVKVEEGRVEVRGFLNMSPNTSMPIEYFCTRFPEAGHETLIHLLGDRTLEDLGDNPYGALKGLPTALYKGMVAAGFREGEPTHPEPGSDPREPTWALATGDVVYAAVRYEHDGRTHVALATDWILDPETGTVLPVDALRFTGSARGEDPDTGEEILGAEAMGLIVSTWSPNAAAMIEVAMPSALADRYTYNFSRIPKPEGASPLYLDVILSRTPIEPEGDGALPIDRPPPLGGPDGPDDGGGGEAGGDGR